MAHFWDGFSHSPGCKQSTYRQQELRALWEISSKGKNSPSRGFIPRRDKSAFGGAGSAAPSLPSALSSRTRGFCGVRDLLLRVFFRTAIRRGILPAPLLSPLHRPPPRTLWSAAARRRFASRFVPPASCRLPSCPRFTAPAVRPFMECGGSTPLCLSFRTAGILPALLLSPLHRPPSRTLWSAAARRRFASRFVPPASSRLSSSPRFTAALPRAPRALSLV